VNEVGFQAEVRAATVMALAALAGDWLDTGRGFPFSSPFPAATTERTPALYAASIAETQAWDASPPKIVVSGRISLTRGMQHTKRKVDNGLAGATLGGDIVHSPIEPSEDTRVSSLSSLENLDGNNVRL
jgi:hypothetical protein